MAYMPQYNPYAYQQFQPQQPVLPRSEVVRVNGKGGADAYQLAPNSSIILLDETAPIIWLKMTDGAGYPTLTPYDITPHKEVAMQDMSVNVQSLEERIARLEVIVNEQSNIISNRQAKPTAKPRANKANDADGEVSE